MNIHEISKTQEVKYSLRQSMWKKTKNVLDIVKKTGIITIPGLHSSEDTIGKEDTGDWNNDQKKIRDIKKDDLIVIFENGNRNRALLVRMKGDVMLKQVSNVLIYRKKGFNNGYTQGQDVIQVSLDDFPRPKNFISNETISDETMEAYTREVEIVREVNRGEVLFQKYWKFQGHIQKNRAPERFINV